MLLEKNNIRILNLDLTNEINQELKSLIKSFIDD
ncbi:hypothetical protein HNQ88_003939 [Aureibacter tunicatorum]|uniref:Uncharacterized protein n=1 Tax=Aureibacter tunicatorum TaxID=866807 RepID=A0AAE3XRR5_9BACT|nr:hypothetical protein [Aureibacter tunicatorum]BDD06803.1 hypothetical protein AUTU_42860 [Aureibacter tunicatorum]